MNENAAKTIPHDGIRELSVGIRLGTVAGYCVAMTFIILLVGYIYCHREEFSFISNISAPYLILAGMAQLLCFPIAALQLRLLLRHHGICMPFRELIAITMSIFLGNLLLPMRWGTGGAAFYLKEIHGLSLIFFGVIFAGAALLSILVNTGLALCGFVILYLQYGFVEPTLSIAVSCLFAACFFLCIFPPSVRCTGRVLPKPVKEAMSSWHVLSRDRKLLFKLTLLMALISMAIACCFYFIYLSIGSPQSIEAALITSTLGTLATLIPGVPGSFGIFDTVVIKIPQLFGLDTPRSLFAALVYRLVLFSYATSLGVPGILYLVATIRSRSMS